MLKKKNWSRILKRWKTWLIYPVLSWSEKLIFMPYLRKTFRIITYWHSNFQKKHLNNVPTTAWQMQDRKSQKLLQYFENFFFRKRGTIALPECPLFVPIWKNVNSDEDNHLKWGTNLFFNSFECVLFLKKKMASAKRSSKIQKMFENVMYFRGNAIVPPPSNLLGRQKLKNMFKNS